jgi:hypothetical protein
MRRPIRTIFVSLKSVGPGNATNAGSPATSVRALGRALGLHGRRRLGARAL